MGIVFDTHLLYIIYIILVLYIEILLRIVLVFEDKRKEDGYNQRIACED